jgi:uncharacterized OsmC-like protein
LWFEPAHAGDDRLSTMDATRLREVQAPLKDRYRTDPASARTPLGARGSYRDAGITCTVEGWAGPVRAGLHTATGGDGEDACSGDMLLEAILACAGVTLRSVATAMGLPMRSATIRAEGWFDARGTLGVDREAPVGVQGIVVTMDLDTDADDMALDRLARVTERYCVVGQSLRHPPRFVVRRHSPGGAGTADAPGG